MSQIYEGHLKPSFVDGIDVTGGLILLTGAAASLAATEYDQKVKRFFNKKPRLGTNLTSFGNSFGTRYLNIMIAGVQMIWDPSNGMAHLEALLGTNVMVFMMKKSIHRTRPNGANEDSFPSGHTSSAFSSSGSLSYAYGWKAAIPAYTLTTLTILARLEDNKHWLSDLLMATSIGIYWARSAGFHHGYLTPIILKEGGGVQLSLNI